MQHSYNYWLVALSFGVAALASYTAFAVSSRISLLSTAGRRFSWLVGGAVSMGVGIWSMHFLGMLAFSLPIPIGYNIALTVYSLVIAIAASLGALYLITHVTLTKLHLALSGVLLGGAIAAMHYMGMAAMQMQPAIQYDTTWFIASVVIAIGAATVALWIGSSLNRDTRRYVLAKRIGAAVVLGSAISGMHYAGMAAASFPLGSICGAAGEFHANWLATTVALLTCAILLVTLMVSSFSANTSSLVHSLATLNGQVVKLATLDPLTELANRQTLSHRFQRAVEGAESTRQTFALLSINLDNFRLINDTLGHAQGDNVIKAIASRLRESVRGSDTIARLGGDEFAILLTRLVSQQDAEERVTRLLAQMQEELVLAGKPLRVTPSIGIAIYPSDGNTLEALLKSADAALHVAKQAGRNRYRFFEASMNEALNRTAIVQQAIREALEKGYLYVMFQPKYYAATGALSGGEALLRLDHPTLGSIGPAEFIPIAEHCDLIGPIGNWVLRATCRQLHAWDVQKLPLIKIAVNLSAAQLKQPDLVKTMQDIVLAEGMTAGRIILEITETVAMDDADKSTETIHALQRCGFDISIDDFGTGYSSFAYLQRFNVKQLKIDRFFIQSLDAPGPEGRAIVSSIISLAHSLQIEVVSEGVETETQLAQLKSLGCDEVQGFLLGKALSAHDFGELAALASNALPAAQLT